MIELLLPSVVAAFEVAAGEPCDPLLPEEHEVLGEVVARRRAEFEAGRSCARRALAALGQPPRPLLVGGHREPCWPDGFVGSITHCPGFCAAAVARSREIATIGIDAEVDEPLPAGIVEQIALPVELEWLRTRTGGGCCWDRLLFSAKESVFKAWFPLAGGWLGFEQAHVTFAPRAGTFRARLLVERPQLGGPIVRGFDGRFLVADGFALTAIALPARSAG